jgi:hypothetical protein
MWSSPALDEFFTCPATFSSSTTTSPWRITGNSSVYRFELGAHRMCWNISAATEEIRKQFRNEQAYLSDFAQAGQAAVLACRGAPASSTTAFRAGPPTTGAFVPEGARIVIFHGECNPPDALAGRRNRRFRFIKPARWVAEHWRE